MPRRTSTRPLRLSGTRVIDGYTVEVTWVQEHGTMPVIEEVFIGGSTHNAIDFIHPNIIEMWEDSLVEVAIDLREDYAYG